MKGAARPGRPFVMRGRRAADTENLEGGPPAWRKLLDTATSFQGQGHTASTATIAEHLFRPRERR